MKRENHNNLIIFIVLFSIILFLLSISLVSAGILDSIKSSNPGQAVSDIIDIISGVAKPIFVVLLGDSTDIFIRGLIFLTFLMIFFALMNTIGIFEENNLVNFLVATLISILGVRFMPDNLIEVMAAPSTTAMSALIIVIPFGLYVFVVSFIKNAMVRRMAWIAYGGILLSVSIIKFSTNKQIALSYGVVGIVSLALFYFDGTLHRITQSLQISKNVAGSDLAAKSKLYGDLRNANDLISDINASRQEVNNAKRRKKEIMKRLAELES
ncbi:MAG: hypothetical protein WC533_04365 [Candidatus Pacearchaeota archaeon]